MDSTRVRRRFVRLCGDFWPDGMTFDLGDVKVCDNSGPKKYGRYGVVWGNIHPSLRTRISRDVDFSPIIWWAEEQEVKWHETHGPFVEFPQRSSMAASSQDLTYL